MAELNIKEEKTPPLKVVKENEFHLTEMQAENAPVKDIDWHGSDLRAEARVEDSGTGKPVVIRCLEFQFSPLVKVRPTASQILTKDYIKHLENKLYFDFQLEMILPPKVIIEKKGFKIFCTCQSRKGTTLPREMRENLKTLQDIVTPKHKN